VTVAQARPGRAQAASLSGRPGELQVAPARRRARPGPPRHAASESESGSAAQPAGQRLAPESLSDSEPGSGNAGSSLQGAGEPSLRVRLKPRLSRWAAARRPGRRRAWPGPVHGGPGPGAGPLAGASTVTVGVSLTQRACSAAGPGRLVGVVAAMSGAIRMIVTSLL
jgi:hypothetical protein